MSGYDVKRLAWVLAAQAEIEGMKAANKEREQRGESLAYNEGDFQYKAKRLEDLACSHDLQL